MAKTLDEAAVRHVAHLARLSVTDAEVVRFVEQLSSILDYVQQLNELNTQGVSPTSPTVAVSGVLREDVVRASWGTERALHNAPQHQDGFFRVPKVLNQGGGE